MASTDAGAEAERVSGGSLGKRMQRASIRLLCCSVCLPAEERDALQGQGQRAEGLVQITVEDLGLVNPGFSLSEEDQRSCARACQRAMAKRRLQPLSSLPIQVRVAGGPGDGEGEEEDEQGGPLVFRGATGGADFSGAFLMPPPVINLIPPTPSDFVGDGHQFFDIASEEESMAHASASDGSVATGDQESYEERVESVEPEEEIHSRDDTSSEPEGKPDTEAENEATPVKVVEKEKPKPGFLRSAYQVAPLPDYPRKRSLNAGINLLPFTEHNLDDLNNKDVSCSELLKAELCLLPLTTKMETFVRLRKPTSRSCSLGETVTRSHSFHVMTQTTHLVHEEDGSPRQRRITVASYIPQSKDQNGNLSVKDVGRQEAKSLGELNTAEVCQWFSSIGLQKCLPFIREAELCGADIAAVDVNTMDILHIYTLAEREKLLSAIYKELHPPNSITQRIDNLLETLGPNSVERFTAALVSMSKSRSSLCLNTTRSSLKLRSRSQNYMVQRNSQLIEITINASEQIVHLRTPKETTVEKVIRSCIKMLGMTESKDFFTLKDKKEPLEELTQERQVGTLLTPGNRQLELHLCKKEQPKGLNGNHLPNVVSSPEKGNTIHNIQGKQPANEEKLKELNQQVDSLQNVILQVQELHHGLVAFCTELKSVDVAVDVTGLGSAELEQRLDLLQGRLKDKRKSLQNLKENFSNAAAHRKKQLEFHLVDKMKLNCQVFKEEISLVHLNRQVAYLQNALKEKERVQQKGLPIGSLSQLVSPHCPAILLVVQERLGPDGRYAFTCHSREGSGLVVAQAENTHLCLDDRLLEVNGVPVLNATEEELADLLLQGSSAQIVALRRPSSNPTSQNPLLLDHMVDTESPLTEAPESAAVTTETYPQCKLISI